MNRDNNKIAYNTFVVFFRLIVVGVLELLTVQVSLRVLGAEDFGLYNVVGGIVILMNLVNTAMQTTTFRYIAYEMGRGENGCVNKIFNISWFIFVFISIVLFLIAEIVGVYYINNFLVVGEGKLPDAIFVFRLSVLTAIISMLSVPYQGLLVAKENFILKTIADTIWCVLRLAGVYFLIGKDSYVLRLYGVVMLFAMSIRSLVYVVYCFRKFKDIVRIRFYTDWNIYKQMFSFNNWILLGAGVSIYKSQGTTLVLNYFFGTLLNAAFAIANQVHLFISSFTSNLNTAAVPQITKSYSSGNTKRSIELVNSISKYSFFLLFVVALPILLETRYLLTFWLKEVPAYTVQFTQLMVLSSVFESLGLGIPPLIQATGKVKWFSIIGSIITLVSLPLACVFYKFGYPPATMLIILCGCILVNALLRLYLLYRIIRFDVLAFVKNSYLKVFVVMLLLMPLFVLHSGWEIHNLGEFFCELLVCEIYLLMVIYGVGLNSKEKLIVRSKIFQICRIKY